MTRKNGYYRPLVFAVFHLVPKKLGPATPEVKGTRPPPMAAFPLLDVFAPPIAEPPIAEPPIAEPPRVPKLD
jgi:hypothetical protein